MTGNWEVMNAVSAIAWITSYKHHILGIENVEVLKDEKLNTLIVGSKF